MVSSLRPPNFYKHAAWPEAIEPQNLVCSLKHYFSQAPPNFRFLCLCPLPPIRPSIAPHPRKKQLTRALSALAAKAAPGMIPACGSWGPKPSLAPNGALKTIFIVPHNKNDPEIRHPAFFAHLARDRPNPHAKLSLVIAVQTDLELGFPGSRAQQKRFFFPNNARHRMSDQWSPCAAGFAEQKNAD